MSQGRQPVQGGLATSRPGRSAAAMQPAHRPAATPGVREDGESSRGRWVPGARGGAGNNKPFFLSSLDSPCMKSLVFPNQKWEDLAAALWLLWLHPSQGPGQSGPAALGPSPLRLGCL